MERKINLILIGLLPLAASMVTFAVNFMLLWPNHIILAILVGIYLLACWSLLSAKLLKRREDAVQQLLLQHTVAIIITAVAMLAVTITDDSAVVLLGMAYYQPIWPLMIQLSTLMGADVAAYYSGITSMIFLIGLLLLLLSSALGLMIKSRLLKEAGESKGQNRTSKIVIVMTMILIVLLIAVVFVEHWGNQRVYVNATEKMATLDTTQLEEILNGEQEEVTLIYMGRKTCPDCVQAIGDIKKMFQNNQTLADGQHVAQYYFDTDANRDENAAAIRESLDIYTVPSVLVVRGDDVTVHSKRFAQIDLNAEEDGMLAPLPKVAFGFQLPVYGNWCGLNYGEGMPIDYLDKVCMDHKQCLASPVADCLCDRLLLRAIEDKLYLMKGEQKQTAEQVKNYYSKKDECCTE